MSKGRQRTRSIINAVIPSDRRTANHTTPIDFVDPPHDAAFSLIVIRTTNRLVKFFATTSSCHDLAKITAFAINLLRSCRFGFRLHQVNVGFI
jgi:hypothetical protein